MKAFFIVVVVIALAALAAVGYLRADLLSNVFGGKKTGTVQTAVKTNTYTNAASSLSFSYPETYDVEERDFIFNNESVHSITILPKGRVIPEGGEGGVSMNVSIFPARTGNSLIEWLQTMNSSAPPSPAPAGGFAYQETTVGGEPALAYRATGLYESDNVAIMKGGRVYVFSATWMSREDVILKDFSTLVSTVSFK